MNKYFTIILSFTVAAALQLLIAPALTFSFIGPDFIAIVITYYGARNGHIFGSLSGFIVGMAFDLISGGLIGSSMFAYTLVGFVSGYFYKEDDIKHLHSFQFMGIVLITSSLGSFFYSLFSGPELNSSFLFLLIEQGFLPGVYTSLLSFPYLFVSVERGIE